MEFHREFYCAALREMGRGFEEENVEGWLVWFREIYTTMDERLRAAEKTIHELWGKDDPESREEWKKAVAKEIELTRFAVERFQNHKKVKAAAAGAGQ